jgi:hypothetical protein
MRLANPRFTLLGTSFKTHVCCFGQVSREFDKAYSEMGYLSFQTVIAHNAISDKEIEAFEELVWSFASTCREALGQPVLEREAASLLHVRIAGEDERVSVSARNVFNFQ